MIALLQRVTEARVFIENKVVGEIAAGLLIFVAIENEDNQQKADRLLERILNYRIFPDELGKMNLSVHRIGGGMLLVPQFTLAADTTSGTRPSFSPAAASGDSEYLFNYFVTQAQAKSPLVATGRFGADMQVALINDGPVTFWLQT